MQREGIFREMKLRDAYEKPSVKRAREQAEAVRRARKLACKKLQCEEFLPPPKKTEKPRSPGMGGGCGCAGKDAGQSNGRVSKRVGRCAVQAALFNSQIYLRSACGFS